MLIQNLPALQVIVPLIGAPLCALLSFKRGAWLLATIVSAVVFWLSILLTKQVYTSGTLLYVMGGWVAPFGIEYRIDSLSTIFLMLISGIGFLSCIYALPSVEKEIEDRRQKYFYASYLLLLSGLLGMVATNDIFNIYVFLEISSLATYGLVAMGSNRQALMSAFEYLIIGTIGATFILFGIGLVYSATGSLNITDIAKQMQDVSSTLPVKMSMGFLVIGLCMKIAIFPLHQWLINAYNYAPSVVSSFLCATATKVAIYLLLRLTFFMFGSEFSFSALPLGNILIFLGITGLLLGSVIAIMQDNIKRMLAYSSVAQIGYILIGIGLANIQGVSASILHVVAHSLAKCAMFMAVGAVLYSVKGARLENFHGIGKIMPFTMAAFVISGLSLVGVPGTIGFISKWYLLQAAIAGGMWAIFIAVIISSLLTLIYIWKVVERAFFEPVEVGKNHVKEAPVMMLVPMFLLSFFSIILGLFPSYMFVHVGKIAAILFGG